MEKVSELDEQEAITEYDRKVNFILPSGPPYRWAVQLILPGKASS